MIGQNEELYQRLDICFVEMVLRLKGSEYDTVLQELLVTAMEEPSAIEVLRIALDSASSGLVSLYYAFLI